MDRAEFVELAEMTRLTPRRAEAFYRRHVAGEGRQEAAAGMETSDTNVDNLERAARDEIRKASNLLAMIDAVGYEYGGEIGTCAECDQPARSLDPDPRDDTPLEEVRMLCEDCSEAVPASDER